MGGFKGFGFGGKGKGDLDVDVDVDKPHIEGGIEIKGPKFSGKKGDDSDSDDEDGKKKKGFGFKGFGFGGKGKGDLDVDVDVDEPHIEGGIDIKGPKFSGKKEMILIQMMKMERKGKALASKV